MKGKYRNSETLDKITRARFLFIVKGLYQKDVARIVGISPKTMCYWTKEFKWNAVDFKGKLKAGGFELYMDGFTNYVQKMHPEIGAEITTLAHRYMLDVTKKEN
jgi:DNA-binding XRE family transcriptional regulator